MGMAGTEKKTGRGRLEEPTYMMRDSCIDDEDRRLMTVSFVQLRSFIDVHETVERGVGRAVASVGLQRQIALQEGEHIGMIVADGLSRQHSKSPEPVVYRRSNRC